MPEWDFSGQMASKDSNQQYQSTLSRNAGYNTENWIYLVDSIRDNITTTVYRIHVNAICYTIIRNAETGLVVSRSRDQHYKHLPHYWMGDRKGIRPVKHWVFICWWWQFEWSIVSLTAPVITTTSIILSSNKIWNEDTDILVPAYPVCHGKCLLNKCIVILHCRFVCLKSTIKKYSLSLSLSLSLRFNSHFPGEPGLAGDTEAKDDGGGGDNWSYKSCKARVKSSLPTNQHPAFYRPDALPVTQSTVSKHWR